MHLIAVWNGKQLGTGCQGKHDKSPSSAGGFDGCGNVKKRGTVCYSLIAMKDVCRYHELKRLQNQYYNDHQRSGTEGKQHVFTTRWQVFEIPEIRDKVHKPSSRNLKSSLRDWC